MTGTGIDWLRPGIYDDIPADVYHSDSMCKAPALSAHIAHTLLTRSPLHAWTEHPKLNPNFRREDEEEKFDLGTVVHALWLQGIDVAEWCDWPDWRSNNAKAARDAARENGRIPLLRKHQPRVEAMIEAVRQQLDVRHDDPPLFDDGRAEQCVVWEERGVTCRALVDWLHTDGSAVDDLKTTGATANPFGWTRTTMWSIGADIQACFHSRGIQAITGVRPAFRFVVAECRPPFAISVVSLGPEAMKLADEKIDRAIDTWRRCLETGVWPAYTREVCYATPPPWSEAQWLEQQAIADMEEVVTP